MNFNDWWNGTSGFGNFTRKELAEGVGVPVKFKDYAEDLEEAFYAGKPKPFTDFTEPKAHPYEDYLMYQKGLGWVVGWYCPDNKSFVRTCPLNRSGMTTFRPSHWLTLPDAPNEY